MAEENDISVTESPESAAAQPPAKKTRQPRKSKAAIDASVSISEQPAKKTRAKRGTKTAPVNAAKTTARNSPPVRENPNPAAGAAAPEAAHSSDEFAELMSLEEENKNLRKQLSEKLRSENAELRKRLGQN